MKYQVLISKMSSKANKTEDPSVPYAGQDYIRVLNVFEITKPLKEQNKNQKES